MRHIITGTEPGSIAEELDICPGDVLITVNGKSVRDVFDYRFATQDEHVELLVEKPDKTRMLFDIEKDEFEDMGLLFETSLMCKPKRCANKCVFCFVDQLPPDMRDTLYFKDDDFRLSFLHGNYVTLTNMSNADIDRIIYYHMSPMNISVHSTEPELRSFMMGNPRAEQLLPILDKLQRAGLDMNFQVVLCKGINDGARLGQTITDLSRYMPTGRSLSVVPAGLTQFRRGLHPLETFTPDECRQIVYQIERWQETLLPRKGSRFVYAADEFYINANMPAPNYEQYEDFPQLENGVGMLALFEREVREALAKAEYSGEAKQVSIVTGGAAYDFIGDQLSFIAERFPNIDYVLHKVRNDFFGEGVTVSGLLTGQDIFRALSLGVASRMLLVPQNALRDGETVFLDGMELMELGRRLEMDVRAVPVNGHDFVKYILD